MSQGEQSTMLRLEPRQPLAAARHWVAAQAAALGVSSPVADRAKLLASEVVTNARKHGPPDSPVVVRLDVTAPNLIQVAVTDLERRVPRLLRPPPGSLGGRGMWLVHHSAAAWGVGPQSVGDGKTVWFQVGQADPALAPVPGDESEAALTVAHGTAHLKLAGMVRAAGRVSGLFTLGSATRLPVHVDCDAVEHVDPVVIAALQDVARRHVGASRTLSASATVRPTLERAGILALFSSPLPRTEASAQPG